MSNHGTYRLTNPVGYTSFTLYETGLVIFQKTNGREFYWDLNKLDDGGYNWLKKLQADLENGEVVKEN